MKTYPFSALFSRMKYITRWSLMRSTRAESLSEHTADTAMLAHTLCLIGKSCTGTGAALRPEVVATAVVAPSPWGLSAPLVGPAPVVGVACASASGSVPDVTSTSGLPCARHSRGR